MTMMVLSLATALALSVLTFWLPMRRGVRALEQLGGAPA
jgi:uncharacterized protein YjiS (DUF1127 family)